MSKMNSTDSSKKIPTPAEFFLRKSLYDAVRFDGEQVWDVVKILFFGGTYDNYCTGCKTMSTFRSTQVEKPKEYARDYAREAVLEKQGKKPDIPVIHPGVKTVTAKCARSDYHLQYFIFLVQQHLESDDDWTIYSTVEKIGQHPSFSDINIQKLKNYSAVLDKEKTRELSRAIGLASHDIGIGSYVYLRRVFESLVEDAHQVAKKASDWNEEEYVSKRMSEKIQMLKAELPPFLVEHPKIYSILSKGIHELSESDCLKNFETLRLGTELILDQRIEAKEREEKIKAAREALGKI